MKLARIAFSIAFVLLFASLTAANYSNTIVTDEYDEFVVNEESHNITLNYVDGGADITVDGVKSKYVQPLDRDSYGYGLYKEDKFTVNNITVEITKAEYDTEKNQGKIDFTAYKEEAVKTITEGQEVQFHLNDETNVLALKYVDGGAAIKLNNEETSLGNELQRGDKFYYENIGVEAVDYGYRDNKAFLEYRTIKTGSKSPKEPKNNLGDVTAQCEIGDATQGNTVEYSINVPDYSNYRDLDAFIVVRENAREYHLAERGLRGLSEGDNSYRDELTLPTPVADGRHEVFLELENEVGEGNLVTSCGSIGNETEANPISGVEINYQNEGSSFDFSTNAESRHGIEKIEWDLTGNNQYEERGREVTKTFESSGEKEISLKVTDSEGNTATVEKTISIENTPVSTSISMNTDSVNRGKDVKFDVNVAKKHQKSGYTVVIEDPNGDAVWRDKKSNSFNSYSIETSDWVTGEYNVKIKSDKNIIRSVIDLLTGRESLAAKSFEIQNPVEPWKEFCQEQNYNVNSISNQINCIREEITPRWFEDSAESNTEVANSLCEDLLNYKYSESENRCVKSQ